MFLIKVTVLLNESNLFGIRYGVLKIIWDHDHESEERIGNCWYFQ